MPLLQLLHFQVDKPAGNLMHLCINLWTDQFTELADHLLMLIQLYCADLDDLKGNFFFFCLGTALIPF